MRYVDLCSGISAATVAWRPLGWHALAFSEIEPFCCALLKHHYPEVPNLGNLNEITQEQIAALGPVDVVIAGTPCQGFSVAGQRGGLDDPRSQLALRFCQLIAAMRPVGSCGRTSLDAFPPLTDETTSGSSPRLQTSGILSPGQSWTLSISDWRSGASVCSLSDILEATGDHLLPYYLTARACLGILRRAAKRGKVLPTALARALKAVADSEPTSSATEESLRER